MEKQNTKSIGVHLSVCDDRAPMSFGDTEYPSGFRGEIDSVQVNMLDNDIVEVDLGDLGLKPKIGDASRIEKISVRVCAAGTSVIAVYDDVLLNAEGCCVTSTCSNGITVTVYGSVYCDPCPYG